MQTLMAKAESEAMSRLITRVQQLLELRNLTITDFAIMSGVTREQLSRILNGHHVCNLETCEKIANGFGISIGDLVDAEKNSKKSA